MKNLLLLVFGWVFFACTNLLAVNTDYTQIDQHAREAPAKLKNNLPKLTSYLIKPAKNDYQRVRSFYVWISENIAYDVQLFRSYNPSRYQPISPLEVVQRGKAVCQGYAELFQEMCRLANISCHVVPGYSKGFNYTPKSKFTNADHAWNVVKVEGKWRLIDVTWGSGGLNENMKYVKQFKEEYFLTSPEVFVLNHLPLAPMWQLLDCPVPMQAYLRGNERVKQHLQKKSGDKCLDYQKQIAEFEAKPKIEGELFAANQAYEFNPDNPVVMARAYMDFANQLMGGIPRKLSSKEAIEAAIVIQEEALDYLQRADRLLAKTNDGSADNEKRLIAANLQTSQQNLKGLRNAIK